ncbi:hypothetical protein, partial [Limnospira platensis]
MRTYPFAVSLNSTIQVSTTADGYAISPANTDPGQSIAPSMVTLPAITGMGDALAHLQAGTATLQQLTQTLSAREGV